MDKLFQEFEKKGLRAPHAYGFMPYSTAKDGSFKVDQVAMATRLANDAAAIANPAVGVPSALVTYIDPNVVPILFKAMRATQLFPEERRGDWTDQTMIFAVSEAAGGVTPYSDFTENVSSDVALEFPERANYLFETTIKYGDREVATAARAKVELVSEKQKAAAEVIAQAHNQFYLYGVAGKAIYGALNDPNLPASIAPISVNSASTWADKAAANPTGIANIVYNDIAKLWAEIVANNGGQVDQTTEVVLALSPVSNTYLIMPNSFGLTAQAILQQNFPNIRIVVLPELATDAGNMLFMVVPSLLGTQTGITAYSEKMVFGRVVPELSSFKQKAVGGTWGAVIKRPSLVGSMLGI